MQEKYLLTVLYIESLRLVSARKVLIVIVVSYAQNRKNLFIFPLVVIVGQPGPLFSPSSKNKKLKLKKSSALKRFFIFSQRKVFLMFEEN